MNGLQILQFNCGLANYGVLKPILDAASPARHQILAIQEPCFSRRTSSTYCPKGYTLAMEAAPTTKVCFMVSKEIDIGSWSYQPHSCYVAELRLRINSRELQIINVYNPRDNGPRIRTWQTIEAIIGLAPRDTIILGDFNCHHPYWGGLQAASEPQSEHLLIAMRTREMCLATPPGEATWRRGLQQSVIDLTFVSSDLDDAVRYCGPREEWATAQDHIPIHINVATAPLPLAKSKRYALARAN
jgi:retrotransposon-encoded endonuclease